jgi:hypothetical protein
MKRCVISVLGAGLLAGAIGMACGGDDVGPGSQTVGGRCASDRDCEGRCLLGGDYPGGYCSLFCRDDRDCPKGALCMEDSGGVCLVTCALPADCGPFGPGYKCEAKKRRTIPETRAPVCVGD